MQHTVILSSLNINGNAKKRLILSLNHTQYANPKMAVCKAKIGQYAVCRWGVGVTLSYNQLLVVPMIVIKPHMLTPSWFNSYATKLNSVGF